MISQHGITLDFGCFVSAFLEKLDGERIRIFKGSIERHRDPFS